MHVAVIGAGAIGTTLGALLSPLEQVTVIGHDSKHLRRLQKEPLRVQGPKGSNFQRQVSVTTAHEAVKEAELIIFAVKSYDTSTAAADIKPYVENVDVLTVQNGLGNIELLRENFGPSNVIGGTTTMGALLPNPGAVRIESFGTTRVGRPWSRPGPKLERIRQAFENGGLPTTIEESIQQAIWDKVLINVAINPITALAGVRNGALLDEPGRTILERTIEEAKSVAEAEGYDSPGAVQEALTVVENTAENRSSMVRDVESGEQTEIGALNESIVDLAEAHGLSAPINRTLAALVRLRSA